MNLSTRAPKGDFGPGKFVDSLMRLGIAPEGVNIADIAGPIGTGDKANAQGQDTQQKSRLNPISHEDHVSSHRQLVCTDAAIEGLRLCHSEFLALVASELANLSNHSTTGNADRQLSEVTKASMIDTYNFKNVRTAATNGAKDDDLARIVGEHDVRTCLEKLGLSRYLDQAQNNICLWEERRKLQIQREKDGVGNGERLKATAQVKRKRKKAFRDSEVTADLIAEQERLLSASANRMRRKNEEAPS